MKLFIFIFAGMLVLSSCNQQKMTEMQQEIEQLKAQNDVLQQQSASKDTFLQDYTTTLNDVYENLENIRKREGLITQYSKTMEEGQENDIRNKVLDNLNSIDSYIMSSKKKLSALRQKASQAEMQSTAFEETIMKLSNELQEKEMFIAQLRTQVDSLNQDLDEALYALQERDVLIDEQTERLHTAYYIIGNDEELEQSEVITYEGGILGLGKTAVVSPRLKEEMFTVADITMMDSIEIDAAREDVRLVSTHAPGTYELVQKDEQKSVLKITNPDRFWKMRYLVIATKS